MNKYYIANIGCDDSTKFVIELDDKELQTIIRFCDENNKLADYQCKPEIHIYKYDPSKECYYDYCDEKCLNKSYIDFKKGGLNNGTNNNI